jgi:hypothetical protein
MDESEKVERLKALWSEDEQRGIARESTLESRLADANALLAGWKSDGQTANRLLWDDTLAHLAEQPATAPKNPYTCEPECESPRCPARVWERSHEQPATAPGQGWDVDDRVGKPAAADQAVLDAMAAIPRWALEKSDRANEDGNYALPACRAELARRGLK